MLTFAYISISEENLLLIVFILVLIFIGIQYAFSSIKRKYQKQLEDEQQVTKSYRDSHETILAKAKFDLQIYWQKWGFEELEKYKLTELQKEKAIILVNTQQAAANDIEKWKIDYTQVIRDQAARQSRAVSLGKAVEHLLPFSHKFPFNYKDARFIGSPIDFIVFDGMEDDDELINIYFVEVKTGTSKLSSRQTKIKEAVDKRRIEWLPINPDKL